MTAQGLSSTDPRGKGGRGAVYPVRRRGGLWVRREERLHDSPELCVEHSIDERRWVSDEVAGADVKDRVLAGSRSE